ncbi:MAG: LamG domain-containing protein [Gammaproteobacteria bacterium]|nr:LamG domain-containing protein [Gammaproteobacteria bacterium]MCF6258764.1 LamG domain-containing protein [Gammaproteobacteria bacterium]
MFYKTTKTYLLTSCLFLFSCAGNLKTEEPSNIPLDQLAAYWSMDSEDINDGILKSKVNGIKGRVVNTSTNINGKIKQSIKFNGQSSYIDFGDVLDNIFAGPSNKMTITMWVKPVRNQPYGILMAKHGDTSCRNTRDQRQFGVELRSTSSANLPNFYYMVPSGRQLAIVQSNKTIQNGAWSHLAITYNGGIDKTPQDRVQIYVDGQKTNLSVTIKRGAFPFSLQDSSAHLSLGEQVDGQGQPCEGKTKNVFEGSLDEVAIWNGVLYSSQINRIRQKGLSGISILENNNDQK